MTKKYELGEAKRKFWFAREDIPPDWILTCPKKRYENARESNSTVVQYVEDAIRHHEKSGQLESDSEWHKLLCEASYGKGLAEGLIEMKGKTYKKRSRSLQELEAVSMDFNRACLDLKRKPRCPKNHLQIGRCFGQLGLAKEGKNMLENGAYWDKINDYLSAKENAEQ